MARESTNLPLEKDQAVTGSYDNSRLPIDRIIIHTMQGTMSGTRSWFKNPNRKSLTSAHYLIGLDGKIVQMLSEKVTGFHAGNYGINQRSIGIEHEDGYNPNTNPDAANKPRPDDLYNSSARLVKDICEYYKIPIDRKHILKHNEVSLSGTSCPGSLDIDRIVSLARGEDQLTPTNDSNISIPKQTFENLIVKSNNWDAIANYLNLTEVDRLSNTAGSDAVNHIIRNQTDLIEQVEKLKKMVSQPQTTIEPVKKPLPQETITTPPPPAKTQKPNKKLIYKDKSIWNMDISEVVGKLLSWFIVKS